MPSQKPIHPPVAIWTSNPTKSLKLAMGLRNIQMSLNREKLRD